MTPILATIVTLHNLATHPAAQAAGTVKITHVQAVLLALLQGVAELFPVSSLGHTVILPKMLGWNINQHSTSFLPFVVALHLGTGIALVVYFWRDWVAIVTPMLQSIQRGSMGNDPEERLGWLVCAGTLPPAIIAVFFEAKVRDFFADPKIAAAFLVVNGFILFFGERLRVRANAALATASGGASVDLRTPRPISTLTWTEAIIVGGSQALALLPGISRSGVTMVAGLATGLTHEASARFAFLLATPIILGAAVLEIPALFSAEGRPLLGDAILGGVIAGIAAFISVRFLMRYFTVGKLTPFAYYCWAAGGLALVVLSVRG
ncbi:MAG: undecaprenyl-diphosphate phosphatase [Chloroflexi bacterium]|nr:undecaprenyl-diphosphate phosphatase [Chloroflexota bacterium]